MAAEQIPGWLGRDLDELARYLEHVGRWAAANDSERSASLIRAAKVIRGHLVRPRADALGIA